MSATGFAVNLEQAVSELESQTAALRQADPDDLGRLGGLLARRHRAIAEVTAQLQAGGAAMPEEQATRLGRAWRAGQQVEERLKLVAAGARQQLQELYRAAWHARALSAELGQAGRNFDLEA